MIWLELSYITSYTSYCSRASDVMYRPRHIILWPVFRQFLISATVHIAAWAQCRPMPSAPVLLRAPHMAQHHVAQQPAKWGLVTHCQSDLRDINKVGNP